MKNKLIEGAKSQLVTLIIGGLVVAIVFLKDIFKAGADVKAQETFITFLKSKESVKFIDSRSDTVFINKMHDPLSWDFIFDNKYFKRYTENKTEELSTAIDKLFFESSLIMFNKVDSIAKEIGIRTDELLPLAIEIGKAYESGELEVRIVRATF